MYKILPILLFGLCFPNQMSRVDGYAQMDSFISEVEKGLFEIIDESKVNISYDMNEIQMLGLDSIYMYNDSMFTKEINEIKSSFPNQNNLLGFALHIVGDDSLQIWIGEINIRIDVDKSIELTNNFKKGIESLIYGLNAGILWLEECDSCISFTNVDMGSLKEANNTMSLHRDDIYDDSWAVIIGIDNYENLSNLDYAVADAEAVKDMLINKFDYPEENIRYLKDEEATLSNIKLNLGEVATSANENDRILVFYSGHGETLKGADGSESGYIIPYEGRQDNPYATGLPMDEILKTCQISKSKHMLFLMDACYSGLMTENVKGLSKPQEQGYLSKVANEKARQIITAGDSDELVIERDEWQHSAFTKNLIEGLDTWEADYNDDGYITADELSTYLRENVTEDSDFQQTPQDGRFRNSGRGEFVFFNSPDKKQFSGIKPKIGKEGLKTIKVQVISEQRLIDYSKFLDNDRFGFLRFKNGATKKDYKIITQSELIDFKSSLIRMFKNKYYYQNYNFVDYSDINNANHNILYSWGDSTINQVEISDKIMNECDCYDVWLIGILQVADDKGNIYYEAKQTGHTLQNRNTKYSYRLIQWHGFIKDSLENIISSLDKEFYDSEIFPRTYLNGKIVSTIHDTLLIKFNGIVNEELIEGLTFNVKRPYYIDTYSTPRSQRDSTRYNNHEIFLDDLTRIIKYINNNNKYSEFLEEYEIKINELNERINLVDETYSSWRENLSIEIKIVGKREELFLGKIIKTKYPWYKPKTKDVIVLHK